jgi:hypothetical protein
LIEIIEVVLHFDFIYILVGIVIIVVVILDEEILNGLEETVFIVLRVD